MRGNWFFRILSLIGTLLMLHCRQASSTDIPSQEEGSVSLQPVPFNRVRLDDHFWKPLLKVQADSLLPFALNKTRPAVENLEKTAKFLKGDTTDLPFPHRYLSSDLYKVMEGAALSLAENPDPELEKKLDSIIDIIGAAQKPDGYLYVAHITGVSRNHEHWGGSGMGDKPYSYVLHSHELYNMGHMYEAAVAYYEVTGKDKWLKIAEKNARHVNRVFFEGDPNYNDGKPVNQAPGHQEIELALVKLYRATGTSLYLEMAKKFLEIRGVTYVPDGEGVMAAAYAQQQAPVAAQETAVGHAVRAAYMYSAMSDVSALAHTKGYSEALDKIWHNITDTKMHITGGLGAVRGIEGFGPEFELPNKEAYDETCAAVGNVLFNFRMFLQHRDAKYMDVAEVALFNNSLAGMGLDGKEFFYVNPLEADGMTPFNQGEPGRSPWFHTACCPSNLARLLPQVSGMMYAYTPDEIYLALYASSHTRIPLKTGQVTLRQVSDYPFSGKVRVEVIPEKKQKFTVRLRIPTWTGDQFVPGALYTYANRTGQRPTLEVNGKELPFRVENGFVSINTTWQPGDTINLTLPLPVRFNRADPRVAADRNRVAISRGPLVYCAEGVDNSGAVQRFLLDEVPGAGKISTEAISEGKMKGIIRIILPAKERVEGRLQESELSLIPYYSWDNRGDSSMMVWFPQQ